LTREFATRLLKSQGVGHDFDHRASEETGHESDTLRKKVKVAVVLQPVLGST
jgi:hypothetical protein